MNSQSEMQSTNRAAMEGTKTVNGTKIRGPHRHWVGPPPSSSCEIFIRYMPKNMDEGKLLELCLLFGEIYQFRVPLNSCGLRGYSFVRYTKEKDAECALELLNHYIVAPRKRLNVVNSVEKCWLCVCNIPTQHSDEEIESALRTVFPNMQRVFSRSKPDQNHTKSVFVGFATHNQALDAKNTRHGINEALGEDVAVVWATTEREENCLFNKSLIFRNVNQKLQELDIINSITKYVHRKTIQKIYTTDKNVVVSFTSRKAADTVLQQMQGTHTQGGDFQFNIKWGSLSPQEHMNRTRKTDFDALLRIKCIANRWHIPVVIFGTFFEDDQIQYAAVLLRNANFRLRFIIVSLQCSELIDIHSRLCEVVVSLIDTRTEFPQQNYVFCAKNDTAQLAGIVKFIPSMEFITSHGATQELSIDVKEVLDLSWSCFLLSEIGEDNLLQTYNNGFMRNNYQPGFYFGDRVFGAIAPNYRRKPPLKYKLDDTRVVLALCYQSTGKNCSVNYHRPSNLFSLAFARDSSENEFFSLMLLPLSFVQNPSQFVGNPSVKRNSPVLLYICPCYY